MMICQDILGTENEEYIVTEDLPRQARDAQIITEGCDRSRCTISPISTTSCATVSSVIPP